MQHLILEANKQIPQRSNYHIIPFALHTDIQKVPDCQVTNYFESTISTQTNQQTLKEQLVGTIHGHKLVGTRYQNVDGLYSCSCYKKEQSDDIQIIATQKIQNITEWRKDIAWKKNEGHVGSVIMYYELMDALHTDVDDIIEESKLNLSQEANNQNNQIVI